MNKERVLEALEAMPKELSTETLIERLLFIEKIEQAQKEIELGKKISLSDAKKRFESKTYKNLSIKP
jgi:hypothetical protein